VNVASDRREKRDGIKKEEDHEGGR